MKKKTIAIGALLLAMNSFAQTDTLVKGVSGKWRFEFDYKTNKMIKDIEYDEYEDFTFKVNKNEFLYLDLMDDVEGDDSYERGRDMDVHFRNGEHEHYWTKSVDVTLKFNGNEVKKVIIYKPKRKLVSYEL